MTLASCPKCVSSPVLNIQHVVLIKRCKRWSRLNIFERNCLWILSLKWQNQNLVHQTKTTLNCRFMTKTCGTDWISGSWSYYSILCNTSQRLRKKETYDFKQDRMSALYICPNSWQINKPLIYHCPRLTQFSQIHPSCHVFANTSKAFAHSIHQCLHFTQMSFYNIHMGFGVTMDSP